jgi:hypothetical protein
MQREEDTGTGGFTGSNRAGLGVVYLNSYMQERWQLAPRLASGLVARIKETGPHHGRA